MYKGYKDPEKKKAYGRKYYYNNKKKVLQKQAERKKNPEVKKKYNAYMRGYMKRTYKGVKK